MNNLTASNNGMLLSKKVITVFGEILIDFTPAGVLESGASLFEKNPGGAPANVAVCVARLGGKAAFIGKAGDDMFGRFLQSVLKENNVDTRGFRFSKEYSTTLAFVELDKSGERSFAFYRNPGADTTLKTKEVDLELIKGSGIFHFGSLSMTNEPSRTATIKSLQYASKNNVTVSYDPNLRPSLWKSTEVAKKRIKSVIGYADILKISEEELFFLTDEREPEKGTLKIYSEYGTKLILVTLGSKGAFYRFGTETGEKGTFNDLKVIDTTGAGDAFMGAFLFSLADRSIVEVNKLDRQSIEDILLFSNAAASLCVTKKGGIPAMPDLTKVTNLSKIKEYK
jgi:fructokinase